MYCTKVLKFNYTSAWELTYIMCHVISGGIFLLMLSYELLVKNKCARRLKFIVLFIQYYSSAPKHEINCETKKKRKLYSLQCNWWLEVIHLYIYFSKCVYVIALCVLCKTEGAATLEQPAVKSPCTHFFFLLHTVQTAAAGWRIFRKG